MTPLHVGVPPRRLLALVAALFATCICLAVTPQALAHDVLISTSPTDGSTVAHTPSKVVLTFDNPAIATGTVLKVTGPSGEVTEGKPVLVNHTVSQGIKPGLPAGKYTVDWRITSIDGHPVSGTFTFTSSAAGTAKAAPATTSNASPQAPAASASPAQSAAAEQSGGSGGTSPWLYVGIAVVVLLLIGGVLLRWRRTTR